jgi:hypothetical protein
VTRARASGVAVALRRVDALAPLASWAPRTVAPGPWSEVGAAADGFGAPHIPWHAVSPGADEPSPPATEARPSPHRSGEWPTEAARPAPVGNDGSDDATGRVGSVGTGPSWRASGLDSTSPAAARARSRDADGRSVGAAPASRDGSAADAVGGDAWRATVELPRHPIASTRPAQTGSSPDPRPTLHRTSPGGVGLHDAWSDGPPDPRAAPGAHERGDEGSGNVRWSRRAEHDRATTGRAGGAVDDEDPHLALPGGALGELVRRWDGPASAPTGDDPRISGPAATDLVVPGAGRLRPNEVTLPPSRGGASSGRSARRPPGADGAPVDDEHLLDVLDVALTELFRRDAERHGLGGLLP